MKRIWVLVLAFSMVSSIAGAAPPEEDALADGDLDAEDLHPFRPARAGATRVVGAPRAPTWLSVVGFAHGTAGDRREIGGFLVLGLPLDRFARGNTRATDPEILHASAVTTQPALEGPFDLALGPRVARACVAAAWRAAGIGADDVRLDAIVARAHWSAALPETRLRAIRYDDSQLSLDTSLQTSRLRDSAGANVGLEARLTWRFDRLLYADDEPAFERLRLEQRDARSRIAAKVLEALFHWQRSALDLRTLPPSQLGTRDEADAILRVMEAEATLDVLTNGWFAAHKPRQTRTPTSL